jgi:hypothetical protein
MKELSSNRVSVLLTFQSNLTLKFMGTLLSVMCSNLRLLGRCGTARKHAIHPPLGHGEHGCRIPLFRAIVNDSSLMLTQHHARLRLALIGMSGAGKSFWAKRLAAAGYPAVCCDDRIEQKLASRLASGEHSGISGVAAWMGWPDDSAYAEREAQYLAAEIAVLEEILGDLERHPDQSLVLDTTGSIIYTGNHLLLRLRRQMTVVYLAESSQEQGLLIERYLNDPKPVLWRGAFQPKPGETPRQTVARCYPLLIDSRRRSYEALAHCTLQVADLHSPPMEVQSFLEQVQAKMA